VVLAWPVTDVEIKAGQAHGSQYESLVKAIGRAAWKQCTVRTKPASNTGSPTAIFSGIGSSTTASPNIASSGTAFSGTASSSVIASGTASTYTASSGIASSKEYAMSIISLAVCFKVIHRRFGYTHLRCPPLLYSMDIVLG
jgi:hypothetical protein